MGGTLICYRCNSNQPGCGTPFNWWWFWGEYCLEEGDSCIKLIERKGGENVCIIVYIIYKCDSTLDYITMKTKKKNI